MSEEMMVVRHGEREDVVTIRPDEIVRHVERTRLEDEMAEDRVLSTLAFIRASGVEIPAEATPEQRIAMYGELSDLRDLAAREAFSELLTSAEATIAGYRAAIRQAVPAGQVYQAPPMWLSKEERDKWDEQQDVFFDMAKTGEQLALMKGAA